MCRTMNGMFFMTFYSERIVIIFSTLRIYMLSLRDKGKGVVVAVRRMNSAVTNIASLRDGAFVQ
jgi:hypothetical protein